MYSPPLVLWRKKSRRSSQVTPTSMGWPPSPQLPLHILLHMYVLGQSHQCNHWFFIVHCSKQVYFAPSSSSVFCRLDTSMDSKHFYGMILEFLDDPKEKEEVDNLLVWWNWYTQSHHTFFILTIHWQPSISQFHNMWMPSDQKTTLTWLREKKAEKQAQNGERNGETVQNNNGCQLTRFWCSLFLNLLILHTQSYVINIWSRYPQSLVTSRLGVY